jgi:hypothetical protein
VLKHEEKKLKKYWAYVCFAKVKNILHLKYFSIFNLKNILLLNILLIIFFNSGGDKIMIKVVASRVVVVEEMVVKEITVKW